MPDNAILDEKRPVRSSDYMVEELDGETVMYSPVVNKSVQLNESSRLIWELCDGHRTVGEIVSVLTEAYPEVTEQVSFEVREMIQQFSDEGIIDWA